MNLYVVVYEYDGTGNAAWYVAEDDSIETACEIIRQDLQCEELDFRYIPMDIYPIDKVYDFKGGAYKVHLTKE